MNNKLPILVVDDEVEMRIALSAALKRCNFKVELSHSAIDAIQKIKDKKFCLILTDMTMPKKSGLELLKEIRHLDKNIPVIIMTAHGTIETAVEAMKNGAFDYILKPFDFDTLIFLIERALTQDTVNNQSSQPAKLIAAQNNDETNGGWQSTYRKIVTKDAKMLKMLELAKSVAKSKATVLIQSESGTGKELLANYIHQNSDRANMPFVAINCAALPEALLESELFGHKKGSFTGAISDYKGKFEQANKGTILLDEITEMALPLQAKLLRVIQEQTIDKIGSSELIAVDVRIIATTNRLIMDYVNEGKFREDLYFRLNVIPLVLPPLRERAGDIEVLANYLIEKHSQLNNCKPLSLAPETLKLIKSYHWRGNVRELENVMERAVLLSAGKQAIAPENLMMIRPGYPTTKSQTAEVGDLADGNQTNDKKATTLTAKNRPAKRLHR